MTLPKITMSELLPQLYHAQFKGQRAMCSTFMRFQEYYESPNERFRGNYFTKQEYASWYAQQRGSFSYYEDWGGFNIPDYVIKDFAAGKFDPLSAREQNLLDALLAYRPKLFAKSFYLIGTCGREEDIAHEVAHGLWYLSKSYRQQMEKFLSRFSASFKKNFMKALGEGGYCQEVILDELQAYIITDGRDYWFSEQGLSLERYSTTVKAMEKLFASHFKTLT